MKANITIFLFLGLILQCNIYAQNWLPENSEWKYKTSAVGQPIPDNIYTVSGTQDINGKTCSILTKTYASCDLRSKEEFIYKESEKLYFYDLQLDKFLLYFDFAAQVGDTLTIPTYSEIREMEGIDTTYILINSISSINLNGIDLKVFNISDGVKNNLGNITFSQSGLPGNETVIENIGRTGSFFNYLETGFCDGAYSFPLIEFTIPEYGTYVLDDLNSNDNNSSINNITIFPNPTNQDIKITNLPSNLNTINVFDFMGRIQQTVNIEELKTANVSFDVSSYNNGTYFLLFRDNKQTTVKSYMFMKI